MLLTSLIDTTTWVTMTSVYTFVTVLIFLNFKFSVESDIETCSDEIVLTSLVCLKLILEWTGVEVLVLISI